MSLHYSTPTQHSSFPLQPSRTGSFSVSACPNLNAGEPSSKDLGETVHRRTARWRNGRAARSEMPSDSASRHVWNCASPTTRASQPFWRAAPSNSPACAACHGHRANLAGSDHRPVAADRSRETASAAGQVCRAAADRQAIPSGLSLAVGVRHKRGDAGNCSPAARRWLIPSPAES